MTASVSNMTATAQAAGSGQARQPVLQIKDLRIHYETPRGDVIAVNGINFELQKGETLGLVGESGCGKTTTGMGILRMVQPPGRIKGGEVLLNGIDLTKLSEAEMREQRWKNVSLVPQGAMNSLNPVMTIKAQIADSITTHEGRQPAAKLKERTLELLDLVGLPSRVYDLFPHELSGGMKQRVCIAMAISLNPSLIIADEPTSALDVVVQRVVAQTLLEVKKRMGVSMILIGHDMGLQAQVVDRLAVMYAGNIVEIAPVASIFESPMHPYTQLLIASIPSIRERKPLKLSEGVTHDLRNPPPGCIYQFRCPQVMTDCRKFVPPLRELKPNHFAACHLYDENIIKRTS
jgi:oligopeptide/dipeptide ABC transporter ATP-binding protein